MSVVSDQTTEVTAIVDKRITTPLCEVDTSYDSEETSCDEMPRASTASAVSTPFGSPRLLPNPMLNSSSYHGERSDEPASAVCQNCRSARPGSGKFCQDCGSSRRQPTSSELPVRRTLEMPNDVLVAAQKFNSLQSSNNSAAHEVPLTRFASNSSTSSRSHDKGTSQVAASLSWYCVANSRGVTVREIPEASAPCIGVELQCGEVFASTESYVGIDHKVYMRLADGRGWVLNDAMISPENPCAVYLDCVPVQAPQSVSEPTPATVTPLSTTPFAMPSGHAARMMGTASSRPPPATNADVDHSFLLSTWYRVQFNAGISVRVAPEFEAQRTGIVMPCGEIFDVCESLLGPDSRIYLRLADGRGWVFDDSMVDPGDCSVVKVQQPMFAFVGDIGFGMSGGGVLGKRHSTRRCRGGKKVNKWKRALAQKMAAAEPASDVVHGSDAE